MQAPQATAPKATTPADPTERLLKLWSVVYLTSALLDRGLTPALRGAWVGGGVWSDRMALVGAATTQSVAVLSCLLLVHYGLSLVRQGRRLGWALLGALSATAPGLILLAAQRTTLPPTVILLGGIAASVTWLAAAGARLGSREGAPVWLWLAAVASKCAAGFAAEKGAVFWAEQLEHNYRLAALAFVGIVALGTVRGRVARVVYALGLLAGAFVLVRLREAAGVHGASTILVIAGRFVRSWLDVAPAALHAEQMALTLLAAMGALFRLRAVGPVVVGVLCLSVLLPLSPLTLAALTLGALWAARSGVRFWSD